MSPPPPVHEQSYSVVALDPGVISELCTDMGALQGSLDGGALAAHTAVCLSSQAQIQGIGL